MASSRHVHAYIATPGSVDIFVIKMNAAPVCTATSILRVGGTLADVSRCITVNQDTGLAITAGNFASSSVVVDNITLANAGGTSGTLDVVLIGLDVSGGN